MSNGDPNVPSYQELLKRTDGPPGSSWGLFGVDDQIGTLNFLTPGRIVQAAQLVKKGKVFNLDYHLNALMPYPVSARKPVEHHIFQSNVNHRDDYVDSFYLQGTSQIDGLRHMRNPEYGFYNYTPDEEVTEGRPAIGMSIFAEHGIVGRGVLLDAVRYFESTDAPLEPNKTYRITPVELDAIAASQGLEFQSGDILLLRTGQGRYFAGLTEEERATTPCRVPPGLTQTYAMLERLWDHQFSVVAADNGGVEASPVDRELSEFVDPNEPVPERGVNHNGMLHRPAISLLGFFFGEYWFLDDLADDCAEDGVYSFFLCAKPINLIGGVGSPPNAVAIK